MEIKLKDKSIITIDMYSITVSEVRSILDSKKEKADPFGQEDTVISKACGISVERLRELPFPDYRKIIKAFWDCIRDPLKDEGEEKNSVSESISV